ncbi:MAG: protein-tyrosine phosphatase family protein, partial [Nitrospiraceae bacterium]
ALFCAKSEVVHVTVTQYPLNLSGQIYGSPMPFGLYDPSDKLLLQDFKSAGIYAVRFLAELEEQWEETGQDLLAVYREEGLAVFPLLFSNYGIPSAGRLPDVLEKTSVHTAVGHHILILCSAGLGRTPLIATLMTKYVLGVSGAEMIEWLGRHQPGALFTPAQMYGGG